MAGPVNSMSVLLKSATGLLEESRGTEPRLAHITFDMDLLWTIATDISNILDQSENRQYLIRHRDDLLLLWFHLASELQNLHPTSHIVRAEVIYETRQWTHAYSAELALCHMLEILYQGFSELDQTVRSLKPFEACFSFEVEGDRPDIKESGLDPPSIIQRVAHILDIFDSDVLSPSFHTYLRGNHRSLIPTKVPSSSSSSSSLQVNSRHALSDFFLIDNMEEKITVSLHWPLQRVLAGIIQNVIKSAPCLQLKDFFRFLQTRSKTFFTISSENSLMNLQQHHEDIWFQLLIDGPLTVQLTLSQVVSRMWNYNGTEFLNYCSVSVTPTPCFSWISLDLVSLQAGAVMMGPDKFMTTLFHRFEISSLLPPFLSPPRPDRQPFYDTVSPKRKQRLVQMMLRLILQIANYRLRQGCWSVEQQLEFLSIQSLALSEHLYSELIQGLKVCASDIDQYDVDETLKKLSNIDYRSSNQSTKVYALKPEMWFHFDPFFPQLLDRSFVSALENYETFIQSQRKSLTRIFQSPDFSLSPDSRSPPDVSIEIPSFPLSGHPPSSAPAPGSVLNPLQKQLKTLFLINSIEDVAGLSSFPYVQWLQPAEAFNGLSGLLTAETTLRMVFLVLHEATLLSSTKSQTFSAQTFVNEVSIFEAISLLSLAVQSSPPVDSHSSSLKPEEPVAAANHLQYGQIDILSFESFRFLSQDFDSNIRQFFELRQSFDLEVLPFDLKTTLHRLSESNPRSINEGDEVPAKAEIIFKTSILGCLIELFNKQGGPFKSLLKRLLYDFARRNAVNKVIICSHCPSISVLFRPDQEASQSDSLSASKSDEEKAKKLQQAKLRQEKILAQFQAKQKQFIDSISCKDEKDPSSASSLSTSSMNDDEDESSSHSSDENTCVMCHLNSSESPMGMIGLLQRSQVVRLSNRSEPFTVGERPRFSTAVSEEKKVCEIDNQTVNLLSKNISVDSHPSDFSSLTFPETSSPTEDFPNIFLDDIDHSLSVDVRLCGHYIHSDCLYAHFQNICLLEANVCSSSFSSFRHLILFSSSWSDSFWRKNRNEDIQDHR